MMNRLSLCFFILITHVLSSCNNDDDHNSRMTSSEDKLFANSVLDLVERQLSYALDCAKTESQKEENATKGKFLPIGMDASGKYLLSTEYGWRSGFFPGCCWMMFEYTNDEKWKYIAEEYTLKLEKASSRSQHDLGFMFNNSYGKAFHMTKDEKYKRTFIAAANTLSERYNQTVGCLMSWDPWDGHNFPVLIDAMMNMELLFEATKITKDSTYWYRAVSHAEKTMENHFREDYSSYHIVSYDKKSGKAEEKFTSQGYNDESYWSRGQSWGLYGFTMCYRFTKDIIFLNHACHIADFLISLDYASDLIPYWDMKDPSIPSSPRDASAAAIMASALLELSTYVDASKKEVYRSFATTQISNLSKYYMSEVGENKGFILLHSTAGNDPTGNTVDVPAIYADYYFMEALMRLRNDI